MNAKRWTWAVGLALCIVLVTTVPGVWAQDYRFSLDRNVSRVIINRDGSADIEYWLTYTCASGAHPIDIVDVGMPNDSYQLRTAQAWFSSGTGGGEEVPLSNIRDSEFVKPGVEVHFDQYTLQPGQQGTVHLKINVREMVYPDTEDDTYASVEFAPHYYDKASVIGTTYLEIQIAFPPGVTRDETRYHGQQFDEVDVLNDRIVFIWTYPDATGSETHKVGVSFPKSYVDKVYSAPVVIGGGGEGGGSSNVDLGGVFGTLCVGGVGLLILGSIVLGAVQGGKRKMRYLPPTMSVEGVGIKRGLTAVEAAILLEKPLNKILTMIMFGLIKKRAIVVNQEDPLRLEKVDPPPEREWREYEQGFLDAIKADGSLDEKVLQRMVIELVKSVNTKMKGFSRKESAAYYRSIVDRAWEQVSAEATPEVKSQQFDQSLEWMMMDDEFEKRAQRTFTGPVILPPWWVYYRPWVPRVRTARAGGGTSSAPASSGGGSGGGRTISLPTLPGAAFASTIVGGIEHTAGSIVNRVEAFTGGVTQTTNPPPVRTSSGSSSTSHRSGGCACACACACAGCACACAGGGR